MNTTPTGKLTGDQYIELLLERQAKYPGPFKPLLEDLIRPGDEELFTPPEPPKPAPQPKRATRPRQHLSVESLQAERAALVAKRDQIDASLRPCDDPAIVNLTGTQRWRGFDRRIAEHARLTRRIENLDFRVSRRSSAEKKAAAK